MVRCLEVSWALKEEREGKDCGSLAAAGLAFGGAQVILRAARPLLYLQYKTMGGRQASRARLEVGVEKKIIRGLSLDPVPEAIHDPECCIIRSEEVGTVSEYG